MYTYIFSYSTEYIHIYIFPEQVSPSTISPLLLPEICQGISIAKYEYVDFTYIAPPARDNLESLPWTAATLCICAACQRSRPPFELEILIWKSNRAGTRLRGIVLPVRRSTGRSRDSSLRSRLLKTRRRGGTKPPNQQLRNYTSCARAIRFLSHFHHQIIRAETTFLPLSFLFPIRFPGCFL